MKKSVVFLLMLVAALAMLAVACGGDEDGGTTDGGTEGGASEVIVAIAGDPGDLGPFVSMSLGRIGVLNTMYEYLYQGETPVIAESFEAAGRRDELLGHDPRQRHRQRRQRDHRCGRGLVVHHRHGGRSVPSAG